MSNIEYLPERGVVKDADGNVVAAYIGMSKEQAVNEMAHQVRYFMLANDIAVKRGYDNLLDMPEDERMKLCAETKEMTKAANDTTI